MNDVLNWNKLYRIGGIAAYAIVLIIPIQIFVFVVSQPPETIVGFFELFHENWIIGLMSLDFLYYMNKWLIVLVYLGLFAALRKVDSANMLISVISGFIGIAVYYTSAVGFEMLSASKQYFLRER